MFYTYVLYSERLDLFYMGSTSNIQARFNRHQSGSEKSTKGGVPWKLIWFIEKSSRYEAEKFEYKLKNLSRKRLCSLMLKYNTGFASRDEKQFIADFEIQK
jgi:putative endonuclease